VITSEGRAALQMVLDRQEIADLCARYAVALDEQDWDALERCFLPDAVYLHPGGRLEGFPAIRDRVANALGGLTATQHLIGTVRVDVHADADADAAAGQAEASSYFQAQHVRSGTPGGEIYTIAGRYVDRLVRTAYGWRIQQRTQTYSWTDGNRAVIGR
jgi:3-phenylpropionate/cinnamic acid dioxygenase small subunit